MTVLRLPPGLPIALAAFLATACSPPSPLHGRTARDSAPARYDVAIVKPQYDAHIGGFIDQFDGAPVNQYLGGWGVRPKIPEIAVEPGTHTLEVGYYDFKTRAFCGSVATVRFLARRGHRYEIRMSERGLLSRLGLTVLGARNPKWTAWVEDQGYIQGQNR